MGFQKGKNWTGNAKGRRPGVKNKMNVEVKKNISKIIDKKSGDLEKWLDETAEKDPAKAADIFLKLLEFAIPKLKHVMPDANKIEPQDKVFKITYSDLNED